MKLKIILATMLLALSSHASSTANTDISTFDKSDKVGNTKGRNHADFIQHSTEGFKLNSLAYQLDKNQEKTNSSLRGRNLNITNFESAIALFSSDHEGKDKLVKMVVK